MKKIMSLIFIVMLATLTTLPSSQVVVNENLFVTSQDTTCKVADPTGTALNVRSKPKTGKVVAKLKNGTMVRVEEVWAEPGSGDETSEWYKISVVKKGKRQTLGWVYAMYMNCNM